MKSTHFPSVRKPGATATLAPAPAPERHTAAPPAPQSELERVLDPTSAERRQRMQFRALATSAMNTDARAIAEAAGHLEDRLRAFCDEYDAGTFRRHLKAAGLLRKGEELHWSLEQMAEMWLDDAAGLLYTMNIWVSIFGSSPCGRPDEPPPTLPTKPR